MRVPCLARTAPALMLVLCASTLDAQQADSIIPPRLTNASELGPALDESYPTILQQQGIGGLARMRLFISAEGEPDTIRVAISTGLVNLDDAARAAARKAQFSAARRADQPIAAWVDLSIRFEGYADARALAVMIPLSGREAMMSRFQTHYPTDLRKARIGARVSLSLAVDRSGTVIDHDIVLPSCFENANQMAAVLVQSIAFDSAVAGHRCRSFATVTFSADSVKLLLLGDTTPIDTAAAAPREPR